MTASTTNINATNQGVFNDVGDNYNTVSQVVLLFMQLSELYTQDQATLTNTFNQVENDNPTQFDIDNATINSGYHFTNCVYHIQSDDPSTNPAQKYGPIYTADNSKYQAILQEYGALSSQLNQSTNQNTSNEQTTLSVATAINSGMQAFNRFIHG